MKWKRILTLPRGFFGPVKPTSAEMLKEISTTPITGAQKIHTACCVASTSIIGPSMFDAASVGDSSLDVIFFTNLDGKCYREDILRGSVD